jgi:Fe-S cluster assembly iron-binding protein IscA
MLRLTPVAAQMLTGAREQRGLPSEYGVRVSGDVDDSAVDLRLGFMPEPREGDVVTEQQGIRLFIARPLAEPLSRAELDVAVEVRGDGSSPASLVLRRQEDGSVGRPG